MIRKLMASSAALALISAGAFTVAQAQDDPAQPIIVQEEPAAAAPASEAVPDAAPSEEILMPEQPTLASVYIGRSVFSSEDPESDNIGDVNDLIVGEDGTVTHAVVGVGGFLGIGEKDVAVPFDELKVVEGDGDIRLIYSATREQLEAAPALERTAYDPIARFQEEQAAALQSAAPASVTDPLAPAPVGDLTAAPMAEPAAPADEQMAATETLAPAEDAATADQDVAATETAPTGEQAMAPEEQAGVTTAAPAEEEVAATEAPLAGDMTTAPAAEEMAATEPPPAGDLTTAPIDEEVAATDTSPALQGEVGFATASAGHIEASDLMGQSVYGSENESIGEISDLILEEEGKTRVALIDVGGFLGVGEKTVGIPFEELTIAKAEDGLEQVTVAMSKEQLEQLPAIEVDTVAADATVPMDTMAPAGEELPADQAAAPAEPVVPAEEPADTAAAPAIDDLTTGSIATEYSLAAQDIAASELIGAVVYGPDDANLGEVSDVIFAKTGDIDGVVIDVGGFLGIGEKPVAVDFDSLNVRTDENGAVTAMIDATSEQLDSAPTYEPLEGSAAAVVQ